MSEITKTFAFVGCAVLALGAAWIGRPQPIGVELPDQVGEALFPEFTDAYAATSMQIVRYDEQLGELREFEVAQKNGMWVIPSHQDYPADAEDNLSAAANLLVGLPVINVVSEVKADHATYGVIRPDKEKLRVGDKGVGTLLSFKDDKGKRLAELIIGAAVEGQSNLRHVRVASIDRVYVVEIDPSKLSTKFEDWVQRDVLDLNAFDIRDISIRDYSINPEITNQGIVLSEEPRLSMTAKWNADEAKWDLEKLEEFINRKMTPTTLSDNEELDTEALNTMKSTLDDLKITDVERKPASLSAGIQADQLFSQDPEGIRSLMERGFYPARSEMGLELRSSDGEVAIRTNDGIEYTLRFGKIAGANSGEDEGTLSRFVMVNASVYEDAFGKPELIEPAGDVAIEDEAGDSASESDPAEGGEAAGDANTDAESTEEGDDDSDDDSDNDDAEEVAAEDDARVAALKEYERQLDEYNEKINAAKKKVGELNYRFADWYYVVSESEYRKIHLSRSDVVKGKLATAEQGFGIEAFRELKGMGLEQIDEDGPDN